MGDDHPGRAPLEVEGQEKTTLLRDPPESLVTWAFWKAENEKHWTCENVIKVVSLFVLQFLAGMSLFAQNYAKLAWMDLHPEMEGPVEEGDYLYPFAKSISGAALLMLFAIAIVNDDLETFATSVLQMQSESNWCRTVMFNFIIWIRWLVIPTILSVPSAIALAQSNANEMVLNSVAVCYLFELDNLFFKTFVSVEMQDTYKDKHKQPEHPGANGVWWTSFLTMWFSLCLIFWLAQSAKGFAAFVLGLILFLCLRCATMLSMTWACMVDPPSCKIKVIRLLCNCVWQPVAALMVIFAFSFFLANVPTPENPQHSTTAPEGYLIA